MRGTVGVVVALGLCVTGVSLGPRPGSADEADAVRLDVNDISFLWPVPKIPADVAGLLSLDDKLADGKSTILPQKPFDALLKAAQDVGIKDSAGREFKIDFTPHKAEFAKPSTWKVVAFRVDPSAPGTAPMLVKARGSLPQVRLIVQPVTVAGGTVTVHDVTMHLVYNYAKGFKISPTGPPIATPDKDKFGAIVKDLARLKGLAKKGGVATDGALSVHYALNANVKGFADEVKSFLKKHLSADRLGAMAFMGINPPEPWIFVALQKGRDGTFAPPPNPSLGGTSSQMLILRGGNAAMPEPTPKNVDEKRGVSTALLFPDAAAQAKLEKPVFDDLPALKFKDIPDLIANPQRAHFFNTDCVSCHSESARRANLKIKAGNGPFAYTRPRGVSGVSEKVLPTSKWNVRNFGWFPVRGAAAVATATFRTANEAADSADFINKEYKEFLKK
jgi:hypothetical protein